MVPPPTPLEFVQTYHARIDAEHAYRGELSSAEAKKFYFLVPADLRLLPHRSVAMFGCGNGKKYEPRTLVQRAIRKHGVLGLVKKIRAREKRVAKQQVRAAAAAAATIALAQKQATIDLTGDDDAAATVDALVLERLSPSELKRLRSSCKRAVSTQLLTWNFLSSKRSPNGTTGTTQIDRVSQLEFCSLVGLADDPDLTTLVKKGAWFSKTTTCEMAFGEATLTSRQGLGVYRGEVHLKYSPAREMLSITVYVEVVGDTW
jgi:hypothetical protein|tara:strand:+ start:67 stop:846 length:780 start_codon:yes stop_codon:yes gene_type:complete